MIVFNTVLERFASQGEKTGWTYIRVTAETAERLHPGVRTSYRVRGRLDEFPIEGVALVPMGEGEFIMAINAAMRRGLRKKAGDPVRAELSVDARGFEVPGYISDCLADEPEAKRFFECLPPGHRRYFVRWVEEAKTDATRTRRLAQMVDGLSRHWNYGQMIRAAKAKKEKEE